MATEKLIPLSEVKKKITAVRQYFSGYPSTEQDKLARSVAKQCMEEVGKIKPVDAAPVVHGRWVVDDADSGEFGAYAAFLTVHCSNCGDDYSVESGQYGWYLGDPFPYHYCPNCGAKMDGERRGNDGN